MFSIYDEQTNGYLYSGRNADTLEECVQEGFNYLTSDWEDSEKETVNKYNIRQKQDLLIDFQLVTERHTKGIYDN